ncbi:hypothetical protein KC343_g15042 [Hortaea werneckii]|nr:hypothetical protein KC343_g15042 [Hortaea werneckii]
MASSSAANLYGGLTGTSWPQQSTSSLPYSSHPAYSTPSYNGSYYRGTPTQPAPPPVKAEASHDSSQASAYGSQYASSYPAMPRSTSQSTPSMMPSAYQTPVQPTTSSFGSMNTSHSRPSYAASSMGSPATNGHSHAYTTASSQPYAVRSPNQAYALNSAPGSAVAQSPHTGLKSPMSATPASDPHGQMPYRSGSYAVSQPPAPAQHGAELSGLGVSGTSGYSTHPQPSQPYSYGAPSDQAFRGVAPMAAAQGGAQYAQ